jgi:hypothetical protein
VSFGLLLAPGGPDVPPAARLGALVDVLLTVWRAALGEDWTVVDGPVWGAVPAQTLAIGTAPESNPQPYTVRMSEEGMGGWREDGTINCTLAVLSYDATDVRPYREVAAQALQTLAETLRAPADDVDDADVGSIRLGNQQWQYLTTEEKQFVVAVDFTVEWTCWL